MPSSGDLGRLRRLSPARGRAIAGPKGSADGPRWLSQVQQAEAGLEVFRYPAALLDIKGRFANGNRSSLMSSSMESAS